MFLSKFLVDNDETLMEVVKHVLNKRNKKTWFFRKIQEENANKVFNFLENQGFLVSKSFENGFYTIKCRLD